MCVCVYSVCVYSVCVCVCTLCVCVLCVCVLCVCVCVYSMCILCVCVLCVCVLCVYTVYMYVRCWRREASCLSVSRGPTSWTASTGTLSPSSAVRLAAAKPLRYVTCSLGHRMSSDKTNFTGTSTCRLVIQCHQIQQTTQVFYLSPWSSDVF